MPRDELVEPVEVRVVERVDDLRPAGRDFGSSFVGAELEQLVVESRYLSFERRESAVPTFDEIIEAKAAIIPIATLEKAGGTITQVLATGQAWLIVYQGGTKPKAAAAAKKVEVR